MKCSKKGKRWHPFLDPYKIEIILIPSEIQPPRLTSFAVNPAPYYLESSISHHIIWATYELTENEVLDILEKERISRGFQALFFRNPGQYQSVKNVFHVHVFSRPS